MAQITFENPAFLWLLLALPFLWMMHFYWLRHTKRKAMKFANFRVMKRITGKKLITKNYTLLLMRTLILLFAVLATSQMAFWYDGQASDNAFVIAIDTSASMRAEDILPSRLEAWMVEGDQGDLWGLVEDELILAIPIINLHESEDCNELLKEYRAPPPTVEEVADNPFKVLEQLKPGNK